MTHKEVLRASWVEHVEYITRMPGCLLIACTRTWLITVTPDGTGKRLSFGAKKK